LPDVGAPIIGIKDDSPLLGPYTDRDAAIAALEPHAYQLQHDGFLEFGIIFQYKGRTEEVFVPSAKYLKVWTNQALEAERVFSELGIPKLPTLQFIDAFPRVSESLTTSEGNAGWQSVLDAVRHAFEELPQREPPAADV
jgi:hypothetical protein